MYHIFRIFHTIILDDPFKDPGGLKELIPAESPIPTKEMLQVRNGLLIAT